MKQIISFSLLLIVLAGCDKKPDTVTPASNGVLIVNEGNFGWGNGSISVYNTEQKTVVKDAFKDANGFQLGDVAQSAYVKGDLIYVVVNNSAKVVVLSKSDYKQKLVINIPNSSPRYFQPINDSIAFVTELYANKIWIVNYLNGSVSGSIAVTGETEQMVLVGNVVFVSERTTFNGTPVAQIRVIDINTKQTTKTIPLPTQPNSIALDKSNTLWVLTDTTSTKNAALVKINTSTQTVDSKLDFTTNQTPSRLRFSSSANSLCYVLSSSVYSIGVSASSMPTAPFFTTTSSIIYGFDINSAGQFYVSDAIDYTQSSKVFVYDKTGKQETSFSAGINSNQFVFLK